MILSTFSIFCFCFQFIECIIVYIEIFFRQSLDQEDIRPLQSTSLPIPCCYVRLGWGEEDPISETRYHQESTSRNYPPSHPDNLYFPYSMQKTQSRHQTLALRAQARNQVQTEKRSIVGHLTFLLRIHHRRCDNQEFQNTYTNIPVSHALIIPSAKNDAQKKKNGGGKNTHLEFRPRLHHRFHHCFVRKVARTSWFSTYPREGLHHWKTNQTSPLQQAHLRDRGMVQGIREPMQHQPLLVFWGRRRAYPLGGQSLYIVSKL